MNPIKQRIAIAEACGWHSIIKTKGVKKGQAIWPHTVVELPDYLNDLNACHEMEKALNKKQWNDYGDYLERMIDPVKNWIHATAEQRSKAFLKTLNLWTNES